MGKHPVKLSALLLAGFCSFSVVAAEYGTAQEAKTLLLKAISHVSAVGEEKAFKDFNDPKGAFVDRDLYVFCNDGKGLITANGGNAALIGKNLFSARDPDGRQFMKEMADVVKAHGEGEVGYRWTNPVTKTLQKKLSFVKSTSGDAFCGVGIYAE